MPKMIIPNRFASDRFERDLSNGIGCWVKDGYRTSLTDDELAELKSDAAYYCDPNGPDLIDIGLRSSARATLKRISEIRS